MPNSHKLKYIGKFLKFKEDESLHKISSLYEFKGQIYLCVEGMLDDMSIRDLKLKIMLNEVEIMDTNK